MDFLNYDSDGSGGSPTNEKRVKLSSEYSNFMKTSHDSSIISYNPAPTMLLPQGMSIVPFNSENQPIANQPGDVLGPNNPFKNQYGQKPMNTESVAIDNYTFDEQYQNYQRSGYAMDSKSNMILGDYNAYVQESLPAATKRKRPKQPSSAASYVDVNEVEDGPWSAIEKADDAIDHHIPIVSESKLDVVTDKPIVTKSDDSIHQDGPQQYVDDRQYIIECEEDDEKWERKNERKSSFTLPARAPRGSTAGPSSSTFHGQAENDFLGRSWMHPPAGIRKADNDHNCYIPKKCVKKFLGHTKGVQNIEFYPNTGHLLLSASLDGKCKIWDVYGDRNVRRTYAGHSEAIRSAGFDNTGLQFISTAFDRYHRLWDTETGQVKATYSNRKMAYQVKFHPNDTNIFLTPCHDNRIYQWDIRTGAICQTYNHHLQSANSICFFDNGKKFVSSSDDKKLLVWEYDIPVPITYIQEAEMFSMPYLAQHPSGQFLVGQSMDNTIPVYHCSENVKPMKKRVFKGHNNSGYACQIDFSPNGKFIISGDGFGKLYFWDWKSMMLTRKFQAHENGPCIGAQWHPVHPSWVATCGWDGLIKLWE